ncbi:MAG: helix-turn-helix domain-containing protein [Solirubrobacteraceae bacterium]
MALEAQRSDESARLLTAQQVADLLGVSTETVLRWTRNGDLPGFRMPGGALRYRQDALDAWLAARATDVAATRENKHRPPHELSRRNRANTRGGDHDAGDAARRGVQTQLW